MKINRELAVRASLDLLQEVGLEQLTLRLLAGKLKVQAATLYWHFHSKQDLLDAMATLVLAEGASGMLPAKESADWTTWAITYGNNLRRTLLAYRDGARMAAGTRLTDTIYLAATERIARALVDAGFTVRQSVVLMSTIFNYTQSFVMEEQAVIPAPGERSPQYDIANRAAALDPKEFPLQRQAGSILFDRYDRRFKEGLDLIVRGAAVE